MPDVTRALHRRVVDAGVQDELLASTRRGIAPVNSEPTTALNVMHFVTRVLSPNAGRKQKRLSLAGLKGHILVPQSSNRILGRAGHLDGPFALPAAALGRTHALRLKIPDLLTIHGPTESSMLIMDVSEKFALNGVGLR